MNQFFEELATICRDRLMEEKWLLAPSLRVGHQWLDHLTLHGIPSLNVRIKTLKAMALDAAGPQMSSKGVELISDAGSVVLVDRIIQELRTDPSRYFSRLPESPALARAMFRSVRALRMAGLQPETIQPESFESTGKGSDVVLVLTEYLAELRARGLIDYPEVLTIALQALPQVLATTSPDTLILVPEGIEAMGLEKSLIQTIPDGRRLMIGTDDLPDNVADSADKACTDAGLLKWILAAADAPQPASDGTAEIFTAVGEANEVREVMRRCLSRGYKLDEVELLHTDSETYVPLIYEILSSVNHEPAWEDTALPVTFAEGIPARYFRPGRCLKAWIEWMRTGYHQIGLTRMLQDGLLEIPQGAPERRSSRLAALLRETPIGFGRDRYVRKIRERVVELEARISSSSHDTAGKDKSPRSSVLSSQEQLDGLQTLLELLEALLDVTPRSGASDEELLAAADKFLTDFARSRNEMDNYSLQALLDGIREMSHWISLDPRPVSLKISHWLAGLPDEVRVGGSGPKPGCLHVAAVRSGGHSGRKRTFVVGLDDGRFPGSGLNDPLLLDSEKENLSDEIPKATSQPRTRIVAFARLLARLRGAVTLSFSRLDLRDDRETFPAPVVFSAYRILSNEREGSQGDMMRWLGAAASFAPHREETGLDEAEWWLASLCGKDVPNARAAISCRFPHLARGFEAEASRASEMFTVYDGLVPDPPPELDPFSPVGPVMSSSRLETIGRCPLAYYFKCVLGLEPMQEFAVDPDRWLDPLQFGELLHEVLHDFMVDLVEKGESPEFSRHWESLYSILRDRAERFADTWPPPGNSAYRRQLAVLAQAALVFLVEEEILCKTNQPRYLEVSIGMRPYKKGTALDQREPVRLRLPDGRAFRARARIDRIDEMLGTENPLYSIWDYKSGRSDKYQTSDPLRGGRSIQHALYTRIGEAVLRKCVSPSASLVHFGYFFPGSRTRGIRVLRPRDDGDEARSAITNLCRTAASGCFIATDDHAEDCTFCDYRMICDDVESVAAATRRKLENQGNTHLDAFRELRNRGSQ